MLEPEEVTPPKSFTVIREEMMVPGSDKTSAQKTKVQRFLLRVNR